MEEVSVSPSIISTITSEAVGALVKYPAGVTEPNTIGTVTSAQTVDFTELRALFIGPL